MSRVKSFFSALVCASLSLLFGALLWVQIDDVSELASVGEYTEGTVVDYKYRQRRGRRGRIRHDYDHTIVYDGHTKVFDLGKEFPIGSRFSVLYSRINPENARITNTRGSFWALLVDEVGWFGLLFFSGIAFYLGFEAFGHAKDTLRPSQIE